MYATSPLSTYYIRAYVYDTAACSYGYCLLTVSVTFTNFVSYYFNLFLFSGQRSADLRPSFGPLLNRYFSLWAAPSQKVPSGLKRTVKTLIRLRGCAVWSGPSQSANRIIRHYKIPQWKASARMRLCACPDETLRMLEDTVGPYTLYNFPSLSSNVNDIAP